MAAEPAASGAAPVRDPECVFCKIVAGELPAQVLDSDERTISFMDISPATRGHALVIPKAHAADVRDVSDEDLAACALAARRLVRRMERTLEPDGFNLLNSCGKPAWQTVFHFHLHVVPRYVGDPLELPWLPEEGDADEIARVAQLIREGEQ